MVTLSVTLLVTAVTLSDNDCDRIRLPRPFSPDRDAVTTRHTGLHTGSQLHAVTVTDTTTADIQSLRPRFSRGHKGTRKNGRFTDV